MIIPSSHLEAVFSLAWLRPSHPILFMDFFPAYLSFTWLMWKYLGLASFAVTLPSISSPEHRREYSLSYSLCLMNTLEKLKPNQIHSPFFSLSKTFLFKLLISAFWFHSASTHKAESQFPEQELLIAVCSNKKKSKTKQKTKQKRKPTAKIPTQTKPTKMKRNLVLNCYLLIEDWKQHLKQSKVLTY